MLLAEIFFYLSFFKVNKTENLQFYLLYLNNNLFKNDIKILSV